MGPRHRLGSGGEVKVLQLICAGKTNGAVTGGYYPISTFTASLAINLIKTPVQEIKASHISLV